MGLFLSMSGVVGGKEDSVVNALRNYAEVKDGSLQEAKLTTEDEGCLITSEGTGGVTVFYPSDFFEWDSAAEYLSHQIRKPVFSFHIHDGDLWMYLLYENGKIIDQFNPVPDYWQELDDEERRSWQGSATTVAQRVPGLEPDQIARYLVQWGDEVFESAERKKAYPADEFFRGDDWQLVDFMCKLGLEYPLDDKGAVHGHTYRFKYKSSENS